MSNRLGFPHCTGRCQLTNGCDCPHGQQGIASDSTAVDHEGRDENNRLKWQVLNLQSQLSAKSQECEELKQRVERIKKYTDGLVKPWKIELAALRAENERLKTELKSTEEALADKDRKLYNNDLASLRKRCEDLEAVIEGLISVCDRDNIDAFEAVKEARRFLNQIKS